MECTFKLVVALTIALCIVSTPTFGQEEKDEGVPIFQRTFELLHQEPDSPPAVSRQIIRASWISQKLDHFNENNTSEWNMRYMTNDEFYKEGAPFFIFVGGEWTITQGYITGGHMYDMAKEHNGYLFYTEHRYYGLSRPTSDLSNENLKYLDVRQALADLAHFIRMMKTIIPGSTYSKVVLTGGSYSATMVTWFKKLYPDLATGCWASSAPLHAQVDFKEYKEVTGESIKLVGGEACYNRINNGIAALEDLIDKKRGAEVRAMLKLCNNFNEQSDLDVWTLFGGISDIFAGLVQTHSNGDIQSACNTIMNADDDLTGVAKYILTRFGGTTCNDATYKSSVASLMGSNNGLSIYRQWFYQTCNEYGWYQTSTSREQPFGRKFPVTLYTTMCYDAYGKQFTNEVIQNNIVATNNYFGGLNPEVENVYFTHGQLDPWHAMGILDDRATVIPNYAHCKDLGSISSSDSAEMRASKEKISELVREWVG